MAVPLNLMPLPGSALPTPSATCLGPLPALEQLDVVLRVREPAGADHLSAVVRFALDEGLSVLDVDHRGAAIDVRGSVLALSQAFGVHLRAYAGPDGPFRARRGVVHVPVHLAGVLVAVDGLDQRPQGPVRSLAPPPKLPVRRRPRRGPGRASSPFFSLSVSAAPRARAGRACVGRAGEAPAGLAVVLRLPVRPTPAPPDQAPDHRGPDHRGGDAGPVPLAPARARRRGPLVRAAAEQRDQRFARQLHPAGVDRS